MEGVWENMKGRGKGRKMRRRGLMQGVRHRERKGGGGCDAGEKRDKSRNGESERGREGGREEKKGIMRLTEEGTN